MSANQRHVNTLEHAWKDQTKPCTRCHKLKKLSCLWFSQRNSRMRMSAAMSAFVCQAPKEKIVK